MDAIDVSVVVCTYNRAAFLRDTLASLRKLETAGIRHELLVVDNASTDETPAVIAEAMRQTPQLVRGVHEPQPGVASARNRGICEARGKWIAFFDDDQVADPQWLAELLAMAQQKSCRCVGGANRLRIVGGQEVNLPAPCMALLSCTIDPSQPRLYHRRFAPGAGNLLVQRSVFDEVGLFHEGLREAGEDADLFRRMSAAGVVGWFTPRAISYHVVPAYRLEEPYLRWKAVRNGGHVARRNWQEWGRLMYLAVLAARVGQTAVWHLPLLAWARLGGGPSRVLGARCRLWRTAGYVRFALHFLAPRLFAQPAFFRWVEFRSERELFPAAAGVEAAPAAGGVP
jgi:glycosyltransferase involved in cell wall biosynthesis